LLSVHCYHAISGSTHSILSPLSVEKFALVEDICSPTLGTLDLMRAVAADDAQARNV
jgi:hypothetical protein